MSKKGKKAVSRSPAEFFADNKSIAGFDNVRPRPPVLLVQRATVVCLENAWHPGAVTGGTARNLPSCHARRRVVLP